MRLAMTPFSILKWLQLQSSFPQQKKNGQVTIATPCFQMFAKTPGRRAVHDSIRSLGASSQLANSWDILA